MPSPTALQVKLPACSQHCSSDAERQGVKSNFIVISLTRLGIKPESTAPQTDALYTRREHKTSALSAILAAVNTAKTKENEVKTGKILDQLENCRCFHDFQLIFLQPISSLLVVGKI